jgi:hypothetical protein
LKRCPTTGEVVLHQPFGDQVRLRQRTPEFFRRMRKLAFDDDCARLGRYIRH